MNRTLKILCLFAGLSFALPAAGGEKSSVKCTPNQDRVWVYDSLASLAVQTKLKCGENVEIVAKEKTFVRIRMQDGTEGYVPDSAVPAAKAVAANGNAKPVAEETSLAAQARAYRAARAYVASAAVTPVPVAVAAVKIEKAPEVKTTGAPPRTSAQPTAASPRSAAVTNASAMVSSGDIVIGDEPAAPEQPAVAVATPAVGVIAEKPVAPATSVAQKNDKAAAAKKAMTPAAPSHPARPAPAPATTSTTSSASNRTPAASNVARSITASSSATRETPRAVPAVETHVAAAGAISATVQPAPIAGARTVAATLSDGDSEDYPERRIEDESASAACQVYFSAYGLSPAQYKWIAENRRKRYPAICPAPSPANVDFVVIFTHDLDFYGSTLPSQVHTDKNGFSDFTPMATADTALMSASEIERSKHEYVWVFQMKRGAFDPGRFSPRRRPQFTKTETNGLGSHGGGPRTVEDAFRFIEGAPAR